MSDPTSDPPLMLRCSTSPVLSLSSPAAARITNSPSLLLHSNAKASIPLDPNGESRAIRQAFEKSRIVRLMAVRDIEKELAKEERERRKLKQQEKRHRLQAKMKADFERKKQAEIAELEEKLLQARQHVGRAHQQAAAQRAEIYHAARQTTPNQSIVSSAFASPASDWSQRQSCSSSPHPSFSSTQSCLSHPSPIVQQVIQAQLLVTHTHERSQKALQVLHTRQQQQQTVQMQQQLYKQDAQAVARAARARHAATLDRKERTDSHSAALANWRFTPSPNYKQQTRPLQKSATETSLRQHATTTPTNPTPHNTPTTHQALEI